MVDLQSMLDINSEASAKADIYIEQLMSQAQGDRDFAIKQLAREHSLALGTDDQARAQFLEKVADQLESRIGTIPYDYEVGTTRTNEDLTRTTEVAQRQQKTAIDRLNEDEKVWQAQNAQAAKETRTGTQESLSQRGILSGTLKDSTGLAGSENKTMEQKLQDQLDAYARAKGRSVTDINTETADTLFGANREASRTLEDLKTTARRGATAAQDKLSFGTEAANRQLAAQKAQLERQRALEKQAAQYAGVAGSI